VIEESKAPEDAKKKKLLNIKSKI
jgi:serine/threonine-protein phosphatase 2B catalytic subunit